MFFKRTITGGVNINTEQTEVEDDFIKGLEGDKEKLKNVIPF